MLQKRNLLMYFGLYVATFGLWGIYWFYLSSKEMLEHEGLDVEPAGLWTLMIALPILNLYAYWKHSKLFEQVSGQRYPAVLMMVLWLFPPSIVVVSPWGWLVTQYGLNRVADAETL